jgi:hypothetical protein
MPSLFPTVDPQVAGDYLTKATDRRGYIERDELLALAADPTSPLHGCFEWNDTKAAKLFRHKQTLTLVSQLILKPAPGARRRQPVRAFVHIRPDRSNKKAFMSLKRAMSMPSLREQVIQQALREQTRWIERYSEYPELRPIRDAISATIEREYVAAAATK